MDRIITGFHPDEQAEWVAELECGHDQHVRHRPPFQPRDWVLDAGGRQARIGQQLECPLCDRLELPVHVRLSRRGPEWDRATMPAGLRRRHRLGRGTWGRLQVTSGGLRFRAGTTERVLKAGGEQAIPPGLEHEVELVGDTRFRIDFYSVSREPAGGDPACWADLVCPECGAIPDRSSAHRPGCPSYWAPRS